MGKDQKMFYQPSSTRMSFVSSPTGGKQFQVPKGQLSRDLVNVANIDPVVYRIEERIANATGIPVHADEDMIAIARIMSRGSSPRGGHFVPFGLHHESDTRPNRARTVLVYMHAPAMGGRTVFPLCESVAALPQSTQTDMKAALGTLWGDAATGYSRHAAFDPTSDHPFNDYLAAACQAGQPIQAGSAIMFDSMYRGSRRPYKRTWYGELIPELHTLISCAHR
eukprot:m.251760 g.251760  ORF g.251760 m.251760 type:complete len:223 (-) comp19545_c0_seq1:815-1483(-)